MTRLSITAEEQGVELDLWGEDYILLPATRSLSRKARPLYERLEQIEAQAAQLDREGKDMPEDLDDQMVEAIGKLLDVVVRPTDGTRKASTLIQRKWKSDELTLPQLLRFLDQVGELNNPPR